MSAVLLLSLKDLRRRLRAPVGFIVLLIFPLAFAGMIGLAFGPRGAGSGLPRIRVLLVDQDQDFLSGFLNNASNNPEFNEQFELVSVPTEEEARRMMEDGEASALIVIPDGFTADLLDLQAASLTLVKNPAESILPQVVEETVAVSAVFLDTGVRILGEPMRAVGEAFEGVDEDASLFPSDERITPLILELMGRVRPLSQYVFPPIVIFDTVDEDELPLSVVLTAGAGETVADLEERARAVAGSDAAGEAGDSGPGFNIFGFLLPMVTLMSILFMGDNGMRDLLVEQKTGTLSRLFSSPAGVSRVLAAKVVVTLLLCAAGMAILAVVGLALGWISSSVSLAGAVVQVGAIAFASTGLAALVYGFARSERSASAFHSVLVIAMSLLGGSFVPLDQMPAVLQSVAPYTINYWGIEGLLNLTVRNGGVRAVLTHAAVLLAFGTVGVTIGWIRLSRRFAAGGVA
jgi:ABC-type multidrug transport system permease subunit